MHSTICEHLAEKFDDAMVHLFVEGGAAVHFFAERSAVEALRTGEALTYRFGNRRDEAEMVCRGQKDILGFGKVVALLQ